MKKVNQREELRAVSFEELREKLDSARRMRFSLELNSATAHIKDYSQFKRLRKNIARILTELKQRELQTL